MHAFLALLCLLVIYAFFHGVDIFITILTHHTILDRFRVRGDVTIRQELRCVLLLLIGDVVMVVLRSELDLLLFEVVVTDFVAVVLSAQR